MILLCEYINVLGPGQIFRSMHPQVRECVGSLRCCHVDENRFMDPWLFHPEVNNELVGVAIVEKKIVVLAPF